MRWRCPCLRRAGPTARPRRGASLSVSVFIVTMAHTDQFDFSRLQAVMWVVLFATFSLVTAGLYVFDRGEQGRAGPAARVGAGPCSAPSRSRALRSRWRCGSIPRASPVPAPFEVPPLGGGFAGSWVALLAVVCAVPALSNRADEARLGGLPADRMPAGALIAGLRTIDQLQPAGAGGAYLAVLALLVILGVAALRGIRLSKA